MSDPAVGRTNPYPATGDDKLRDAVASIAKAPYEPDAEGRSTIEHPSHYNQGEIECIDAMVSAYGKEAVMDFCICNAMKYIWRMPYKNKGNTSEDLRKAIWYMNKYLELGEQNHE